MNTYCAKQFTGAILIQSLHPPYEYYILSIYTNTHIPKFTIFITILYSNYLLRGGQNYNYRLLKSIMIME